MMSSVPEHSHAERRKREKRGGFARFYFMRETDAEAFPWGWGYSGRTRFRRPPRRLRAKVLRASELTRSLIQVMS